MLGELLVGSPEYKAWSAIKERCFDPNCKSYHRYGGRGITMCPEWRSFATFYTDMGPRPSSEHSIDRRDVNGPYSKANCRWATRAEQSRNKRTNQWVEFAGRKMILADWATEYGIAFETLRHRLFDLHWPAEKALTHPTDMLGESHPSAKLTEEAVRHIRASSQTGRHLAKLYGVTPSTISGIRKHKTWCHVT